MVVVEIGIGIEADQKIEIGEDQVEVEALDYVVKIVVEVIGKEGEEETGLIVVVTVVVAVAVIVEIAGVMIDTARDLGLHQNPDRQGEKQGITE